MGRIWALRFALVVATAAAWPLSRAFDDPRLVPVAIAAAVGVYWAGARWLERRALGEIAALARQGDHVRAIAAIDALKPVFATDLAQTDHLDLQRASSQL